MYIEIGWGIIIIFLSFLCPVWLVNIRILVIFWNSLCFAMIGLNRLELGTESSLWMPSGRLTSLDAFYSQLSMSCPWRTAFGRGGRYLFWRICLFRCLTLPMCQKCDHLFIFLSRSPIFYSFWEFGSSIFSSALRIILFFTSKESQIRFTTLRKVFFLLFCLAPLENILNCHIFSPGLSNFLFCFWKGSKSWRNNVFRWLILKK